MQSRQARVARGLAAAVFATGTAAASHSLAGGSVSIAGLSLALAFAAIVCIPLAGRRLSLGRLAASVTLSQAAFHFAFGYLGTGDTVMAMGHHDVLIRADAAPATAMSASMWAGHAIAALVTVVLLRHGERAFWAVRELVVLALVAWNIPLPSLPSATTRPAERSERARDLLLRRSALRYRGPPAIRFA